VCAFENSGDTPAAGYLFQPGVFAPENPGRVDAVQFERMARVVIGRGIAGSEVVLVEAAA